MPIKKIKEGVLKRRTAGDSVKSRRSKKLQSWEAIRSIGILYHVPDEAAYVRFTNYIATIQSAKKDVKTLGLYAGKEIPHYCYPRLSFDYFNRKDLNWFGKPGGIKVNDFINTEFDLLVNLDLSSAKVFDYIVGVSKARLKCGRYHTDTVALYDFMISDSHPDSPETLMDEIIEWLRNLKSAE